jgi:hypothetical protein
MAEGGSVFDAHPTDLAGGVVANEVIAKVSSAGTVCLYSSVGTNLAADVTGFVAT